MEDGKIMYMNPKTGSVDSFDGWWYEETDTEGRYTGRKVNAVKKGEVVEVVKNEDGEWVEVAL